MDMDRFRWEGSDILAPGKHTLVFDFKSDGPGMAKGGTGVLKVDGQRSPTRRSPTPCRMMPWDETFDIGVDTRTGVEDKDYQVPFQFTGTIDKLTVQLN